jgi:hypothetical protein
MYILPIPATTVRSVQRKKGKKKRFRLSMNNDTPLLWPLAASTHAANQAFAPSRIIEPGRGAWIPDQIIKQNHTQ